jgi:AbiV family abortive infection protein
MKKNKLDAYTGLLNAEEIANGMNGARRNANRLLADAHILFKEKSYATALSLAVLSIEESGKVSILRGLAVCRDSKKAKEAWRQYRNHRAKNVAWIILDLARQGARTMSALKECVNIEGEHTALLDNLKQIGFYTDCLGNKNWSFPSEIIDESLCASILKVAKVLCNEKEITVREIELWVQCIKEHAYTKQAMTKWHDAMIAEGLSDISAEKHSAFLDIFENTAHGKS